MGSPGQQAHEDEHHHHDQEKGGDDLQQPEDDVPETEPASPTVVAGKRKGRGVKPTERRAPVQSGIRSAASLFLHRRADEDVVAERDLRTKPFTDLRNATG